MGQIADDMVDGLTCSHCGQFFGDGHGNLREHGYPVLCWECFDEETPAERAGLQRAVYPLLTAEEIDANDDDQHDSLTEQTEQERAEKIARAKSKWETPTRRRKKTPEQRRRYRQRRAERRRAEAEASKANEVR